MNVARRTVETTEQRGITMKVDSKLTRRFRSNDRQLRYKRLNTVIFTDTMKSIVKTKSKNEYA